MLVKDSIISLIFPIGISREQELEQLNNAVKNYTKRENYSKSDSERLEKILSDVNGGELDSEKNFEKILPYRVELSEDSLQLLQSNKKFQIDENKSAIPFQFTEIKQINSPHYQWTAENGIVETVSEEEEIELAKRSTENFVRNSISQNINTAIENILKPYETYEQAQAFLYQNSDAVANLTIAEDGKSCTLRINNNLPGFFGQLAASFNNYLEIFGVDDEYFSKLGEKLDKLDPNGDDDLVNQIKRMLNQVKSGESIKIQSNEFREEVAHAIYAAYCAKDDNKDDDEKIIQKSAEIERKKGLSYSEMERRELERQSELLNKLLGKENDDKNTETLGEILQNKEVTPPDHSIRDQLRKPDEPQEENIIAAAQIEDSTPQTKISEEEHLHRENILKSWEKIVNVE